MHKPMTGIAAAFGTLLILSNPGAPVYAQLPPIGAPNCPPNTSCVPSTPPVSPPGTCGPGPGGATCGAGGPASSGSTTGINVGAGNPVNIINGNKYQREVDMAALPGVLGLEIVRHYNSVYSGANGSTNLLGRGWKLSYETELHVTATALQLVQADGTRIIFGRDPRQPSLCGSGDAADGSIEIIRRTRNEEYVWTTTDGRKLSFDTRGKLVQVRHPGGEFLSLMYDRAGLLLSVTDPQGRSLRLNYRSRSGTAFAGVESIDSPLGRFGYRHGSTPQKGAAAGTRTLLANLAGVRYPGNAGGRDYHYEDVVRPTYLTGISVLDGQRAERYATYRYGADGKAISTSHAGDSQKVELDFSAAGRTTLTNSLGQKTFYRHTVLGGQYRLLEVRGPGCAQCGETNLRYSYDEAGRPRETTKLDRNGQPLRGLRTEYDARSRPLRIRQFAYVNGKPGPAELVTRYEYGQFDSPTVIVRPSVIKGKEAVVRIAYNDAGQPLSISEHGWAPNDGAAVPIARTTRYGYRSINGRSLLTRIDGPLPNGKTGTPADSDITEIEWDGKGNAPLNLTRPGMTRSSVAYDGVWRIAQVRSDSGAATTYGYDARGRRHTVTAGGIVWQTRFDVLDRITETGYTKNKVYTATSRRGADLGDRNVWSVTHTGQWRRQLFDTEGRLRETSVRAGAQAQVRQYAYDEANRLSAVSDADSGVRRIVWNAADQAEARIDALGRVQRYRYDGAGQLAEVIDAANTWQAQATRIERDELGLTTGITAANGAHTRYLTDDFGRTLRIDSPDSGTSTRRYDEADRLTAMRDALGNGAEYRYDAAGRIVRQSVTGPGLAHPLVTSWTYAGRLLVAVEHPVQSERYAYDAGGRLLAKTTTLQRQGGAPLVSTTRYQYDADGQASAITLADGSLLQVRRDAMNAVVALERQRIVTPWLRWMLPAERLAQGIRRDLVDISAFEYGNGIGARFERSAAGALARVAYVQAPGMGPARVPAAASAGLAAAFGIAPAHAAAPPPTATPLALRLDTKAVLDYRYLWDVQGNLLRLADAASVRDHAYDAHDRLIVEARRDSAAGLRQAALDGANENHYFYDKGGNRILAHEGATLRTAYAPHSNRWLGQGDAQDSVRYDANGQPRSAGRRAYEWDALGRLAAVREDGRLLAAYGYNHRGERVAKRAQGGERFYLYSGRRLSAELDAAGRVLREYVYLAGRPLAVIDSEGGVAQAAAPASAFAQALRDIGTATGAWFGRTRQSVTYLHTNHLGAPEAATDSAAKPVWKVRYAAFGVVTPDARVRSAFTQPLRLPGQVEDKETGLYYNDHRYYDPRTGRYLSPDPLGLQASANAYTYVESNPLKYVDPEGLVLFAFDGTGNTKDKDWLEKEKSSLSNVALFQLAYTDRSRYVSGVGTVDTDPDKVLPPLTPSDYVPWYLPLSDERADMGSNYSGRARIERMEQYFKMEAELAADDEFMMIDIIGFSRGAAQARDFANRIVANTSNGWYRYSALKNGAMVTQCQRVSFRFMGLWDTVLSTDWGSGPAYQLAIPDQFANVAQAVALNEFRGETLRSLPGSVGAFPLESILGKQAPKDTTRVELGFIGAHADIGGGFASGQNDLARVALNWMLNQAAKAGVPVGTDVAPIIGNPVLHDKSDNQYTPTGEPAAQEEDRTVRYTNGATTKQRTMSGAGMEYADTKQFISYLPGTVDAEGNPIRNPRSDYVTGTVNMPAYLAWLKQHGYDLTLTVQ